jgi:hypothetical protein
MFAQFVLKTDQKFGSEGEREEFRVRTIIMRRSTP